MEKTSAARAIEWNIDLEKSLRSNKPGQDLEAINQMGPRLEQWCREPEVNMSESNMFGLIHGEEKLFANAILLRLADAFTSENKQIQASVVKLFLYLWKNCKKKGYNQLDRVMSKLSLMNRVELLRRVKVVFDGGDTESRALALTFFGCCACIAKERAEIRYLILSSLMSSDVLEVKASLFAAGCFSELSDDFASVFFEILVNMVTSSDLSWDVRLVGVRLFSKMGSSLTLASKAYKIGIKLLLDSLEEDLSRVLLISLSRLASRSICLISGQRGKFAIFLQLQIHWRYWSTYSKSHHFHLYCDVELLIFSRR
ncbi:uncharacterized protein LOC124912233 isoform X1 [Impatiens glandulifera]|uniref:uncharacterized protein LOC124912233 isoform X1 n=1 Tax=Impatiens glandulifera TaxID=253017 RepID=UPI001FB0FF37|nr:uncharacterized protein LOC124912233 isoform X1 [Impatiens glandulifera]